MKPLQPLDQRLLIYRNSTYCVMVAQKAFRVVVIDIKLCLISEISFNPQRMVSHLFCVLVSRFPYLLNSDSSCCRTLRVLALISSKRAALVWLRPVPSCSMVSSISLRIAYRFLRSSATRSNSAPEFRQFLYRFQAINVTDIASPAPTPKLILEVACGPVFFAKADLRYRSRRIKKGAIRRIL